MATPNDPALGDTTEDVVLGPKTLKDTKKHLAQFFSGDLDSDDDGPVRKKKRKAVLDEGDEEDEEPATTTKRKKRSEPESTAEQKLSLSQRLSKPPTALSRPMQKKLDHSMKQQAFYRSGVQARPGRLLQNAVFKKIAELETKADQKRLKKTERTKGLGDTQDEQLLPNEPIEVQNNDDEIMTGFQVNNLQQSSTKNAVEEQTKGSQGNEIAGDGGGEDCLLQVKEPKEGQKKKKKGLEPTYVDSLRETYINDLRSLSMELPTRHQAAALERSTSGGPKYLGRTASTVHGHRHSKHWKTNGSTSQDLLLPSADTRPGFESHPNLTDLSQGQIIYMCGHHLTWLDPKHAEFLSYSKDLLFLLVHALGRHHTGQRNVTIQYVNREESTFLEGEPALFYDALAIYNIFEVPSWSGWTNYLKHALNPRKFTHEFLSHGIVKHNDATLKQAGLEDLIRDGLFELFPELEAPENHQRCGLYTEQVVCRRHGYPPPKPSANQPNPPIYSYEMCSRVVALTKKILRIARKLALNFITVPAGTDLEMIEPPLHIFLQFLTLHKRGKADPILLAWIQQRYNAAAVSDLYKDSRSGDILPGFTTVADNLPGCMQYLDLVRDCIDIFSLEKLPPNIVQTANTVGGTDGDDDHDDGDDDDDDDDGVEDDDSNDFDSSEDPSSASSSSACDSSSDPSTNDEPNINRNITRPVTKSTTSEYAAEDNRIHRDYWHISEPEKKKVEKKEKKGQEEKKTS